MSTSNKNKLSAENINVHIQNKNIIGIREYILERSIMTISPMPLDKLVKKYKGHGTNAGNDKECINFKKVIGYYIDKSNGKKVPTTFGIVHYLKTGFHVVPSRPKNYEEYNSILFINLKTGKGILICYHNMPKEKGCKNLGFKITL